MDLAKVYLVTNTINGKRYVGKTKRSIEGRLKEHIRLAKRGGKWHLHNAIRKYGAENFVVVLLQETSLAEVNDLEKRLIKDLQPEYNMTEGGEGIVFTKPMMWITNGERQHFVSKDTPIPEGFWRGASNKTRANQSESRKGAKHSASTIQKMRENRIGSKNPMFGRKHSQASIL